MCRLEKSLGSSASNPCNNSLRALGFHFNDTVGTHMSFLSLRLQSFLTRRRGPGNWALSPLELSKDSGLNSSQRGSTGFGLCQRTSKVIVLSGLPHPQHPSKMEREGKRPAGAKVTPAAGGATVLAHLGLGVSS